MAIPPPLALAYHGIGAVPLRKDTAGLYTSPRRFRDHLRWLRRWGYDFVTFGELARRAGSGEAAGLCALTFDDGLSDMVTALVPILAEERATATVFVVSGWQGSPHPDAPWARTLDASEIRALADAGVEIGSHSASHRDLSTLPGDEVRADLARSKEELEALTGRPVTVAAYPYGRHSPAARDACRDAGFEACACTSGDGSWLDPWQLPRQDMHETSTTLGLWLKTTDRYEPIVSWFPGRAARSLVRRIKTAMPATSR